MKMMMKQLRPALVLVVIMILVCGVLYTGVVTGIGQLVFPSKANGSIITVTLSDGSTKDYGSKLIAQEFSKPEYLIGRPMMVTNLSPTSVEQAVLVEERIAWWRDFDPTNQGDIPMDLLTASGSGVDPHISPAAAEFQVGRIADARNIGEADVRNVIKEHTSGRLIGFIGEERVSVLQVNLALDGLI